MPLKSFESGFGEEIAERMAGGAGEEEIEALAEEFGKEVSENFPKHSSLLNVKWLIWERWKRNLPVFLVT